MKHVIIGTAGHIDHGKTALVKALTGIDADRLEKKSGGASPLISALPTLNSPYLAARPPTRQAGLRQEHTRLKATKFVSGLERSDRNKRDGLSAVP